MNKNILLTLVLLFSLFPEVSPALERFEVITTSQMTQLLQDRKEGKADFLLVNSLDRMIYRDSSIPGSIHIPLGQFEKYAERLGDDPDRLIITY